MPRCTFYPVSPSPSPRSSYSAIARAVQRPLHPPCPYRTRRQLDLTGAAGAVSVARIETSRYAQTPLRAPILRVHNPPLDQPRHAPPPPPSWPPLLPREAPH